ncbi:MAG: NAD(P)-dependent oxidoreductase [Phyllobacterium sp.]
MTSSIPQPVLIIGGSGIVGAKAARTLRQLHPHLPIAIGGRDLSRADAVAATLGNATGSKIDLDRMDLGQDPGAGYSAIAVFVKDDSLNSMKYAQTHGLPYLSVSSGVFEVGPEMALAIRKPQAAPILMASSWLAGAATFPALQAARDFRSIDEMAITVVLDEEDMGGPAALADFQRLTESAPDPLLLVDGRWRWVKGEAAKRQFTDVDGTSVEASAYSPLDVLSLSTATDAKSIRLDLVYGMSASRRRGEAFSTEIAIEIRGERLDGRPGRTRLDIVHPQGQAPLTALHVALGLERLLGLSGGEAVKSGLYLPDSLMEPDYVVRRMREFGAVFRKN